ncbi:peptidase Do [Mycobacteroides abscessus subsp. abscessus]|uniref:S1 family peptidase n=1 Tax=Mycobacteroides abscessus TaxID=36809 RepID=UPI0009A8723F|nr:serine protease [Mycobacteroides abscessus]SKR67550.1 peptidase Do [Mycobacteroides abscessus subsp. abscessus]
MVVSDGNLAGSKLAALVPKSLGWRLVVAGFAHSFFDPLGAGRASNAALIGKPFTDEPFEGWTVHDFVNYIQIKGLQPGDATATSRLLAAMERAGLLIAAGWDTALPLLGQRYVSQGVLSAQKQGYMWLAEALGPEFVIEAFKPVTVQITAEDSPHWGSGLILDRSHIITNKHVTKGLAGKRLQIAVPVIGRVPDPITTPQNLEVLEHAELDVAVIQIKPLEEGPLQTLDGMVFRDPSWADEVYLLGYPRVAWMVDTGMTLQRGEVVLPLGEVPRIREADSEPWDTPGRTKMFLFSAIARPGNSGGPIVAHDGRVIGIVFQESSHVSSTGPGTDASESDDTNSELSAAAPFYRGIPASELMRALDDFGLRHIATFEDPLNLCGQ